MQLIHIAFGLSIAFSLKKNKTNQNKKKRKYVIGRNIEEVSGV